LKCQQLVVERVASSDNLDVADVLGVDGGERGACVIHLASEHFIAEEPITEDAAVTVGTE